ncbi:DegT/DnrJ/EryC1/StrS family aminotransferase [bacterium]|nr:DegT/DnrJ/EryC1/StrS family aminotransferase [bacterium]
MTIPVVNTKAQNFALKDELATAVGEVLESGWFIGGPNVSSLEEEVSDMCEAKYGIAVNSGTDALVIALAANDIGPGDEVITTPFTFVATTEAIMIVGAKPVYADIDPTDYNLDPKKIEEKITPKTKAILPVHLYGQCADIRGITDIAKKYGLKVIYDGAQAIGAKYRDRGIGAYGDAATLSFYPTKNLGGCGDGGMVLTNDVDVAEKAKSLRIHGQDATYSYQYVGFCSRLDAIQAAVLRVKLKKINEWNEARRANAQYYIDHLADLSIKLPVAKPDNCHVYHQFTVCVPRRDEFTAKLAEHGVESKVFYPHPLHLERAYANLGYKPGDFPETEKIAKECLSIPVSPELTADERQQVMQAISDAAKELS